MIFQKKHEQPLKLVSSAHASGAPTDNHHLCALLITVRRVFLLLNSIVLCSVLLDSIETEYRILIQKKQIKKLLQESEKPKHR